MDRRNPLPSCLGRGFCIGGAPWLRRKASRSLVRSEELGVRSGGAARQNKKRRGESNMRKSLSLSSFRAQARNLYCSTKISKFVPFHKRSFSTTFFCYLVLIAYRCARKISRLRSKWRCARSAIKTPRRFYIFMRRTIISHFSFLISHSIEAFIPNQGAARPMGYP